MCPSQLLFSVVLQSLRLRHWLFGVDQIGLHTMGLFHQQTCVCMVELVRDDRVYLQLSLLTILRLDPELQHSKGKTDRLSVWTQALLARRGHNKACVAVANKLARMAWVIMAQGASYRVAQ
jgi:hypothetical protein